jgi:alpha-D-ribose 1-methylphosphonate 5-phosphate C-P lyase
LGLVAIARVCRIKKMPILLRVWNLDLHDFWKEVNIVEYQCSLCKCVVVPL